MEEQAIISLIGSLGFPIVITLFLLIKNDKTIKELTTVIQDLTVLIRSKI